MPEGKRETILDGRFCTARQVSRPPTYRSGRVNAAKVARPAAYSRLYFFVSASTNEPVHNSDRREVAGDTG